MGGAIHEAKRLMDSRLRTSILFVWFTRLAADATAPFEQRGLPARVFGQVGAAAGVRHENAARFFWRRFGVARGKDFANYFASLFVMDRSYQYPVPLAWLMWRS